MAAHGHKQEASEMAETPSDAGLDLGRGRMPPTSVDREAPQREIARQKKETEDTRASQEKSRVANKAAFRP